MKVLLVNGSPHEKGCTYTALNEMAQEFARHGVDTEFFHIGTKPVRGCAGCYACIKLGRCAFDDDIATPLAQAIAAADGFVLGAPVYYAGPAGGFLAVLDRVFYSYGKHFAGKVAAAIVSARRGGTTAALDVLNKYLSYSQTVVATSTYWNMVHGNRPAEVAQDLEGLHTMRTLAKNMAWLLDATKKKPMPPAEAKPMTNFIR